VWELTNKPIIPCALPSKESKNWNFHISHICLRIVTNASAACGLKVVGCYWWLCGWHPQLLRKCAAHLKKVGQLTSGPTFVMTVMKTTAGTCAMRQNVLGSAQEIFAGMNATR